MKNLQDWLRVRDLHRKGAAIKQIARELGMSKNTVKKLIKLDEEPKYKRTIVTTKIDDFKDIIRIWYLEKEYEFNGTRIYRELLNKGYKGGMNPVYRFLRQLDAEKSIVSKKATVRYETPPGDQAQFDWSEYEMWIGGERVKVYCFAMILSYSRKRAAIFSKSVDAVAVYEAIQDLFIELGGVTKELVIDNPKTLVISHVSGQEVNYNENALRLFAYLQTSPNACRPYRARTKGKIEKPFQYIEEQFVKGNRFESMDELNESIRLFMNKWNSLVHGTTGRIPLEAFEEEIGTLRKLQEKKILDVGFEDRIVSNDSYVSVDTNRYSIPVTYVGHAVKIRIVYGYILEIYSSSMLFIKSYKLVSGRNERKTDAEDYKAISSNVPKSIPEIRRVFETTFKNGAAFYELASRITHQPHYHVREFLKLKDLYEVEDLEIILQHCIESSVFNIVNIRSIIKERYLDLVLEHDIIGLRERERLSDNYTLNEGLVRNLDYYAQGGQN